MTRFTSRSPGLARRAFTLIELLVVISIIALLIAILLPALGAARDTAAAVTARGDARHIGVAMHTYAGDNSDWFPYEIPAESVDNPSAIVTGGDNIYGASGHVACGSCEIGAYASLADKADAGAYRPIGLGQLVDGPGSAVDDSNMTTGPFGHYMPIDMLFSPQLFSRYDGHPNGSPIPWFGHEAAAFDGGARPLQPGGLKWGGSTDYGYGNFYFSSSWSYRHFHIGDWDGTNDGSGNDQWDIPQGQTDHSDMPGKAWANGRTSSPGPFGDANERAIVADTGGWHQAMGGGNYLLRDGSAHWFDNEYHGEGWYTTSASASGSPIPNTHTPITTNGWHSGFQGLLHAAIDRHRQGLPTPGSNGVTIDWNN